MIVILLSIKVISLSISLSCNLLWLFLTARGAKVRRSANILSFDRYLGKFKNCFCNILKIILWCVQPYHLGDSKVFLGISHYFFEKSNFESLFRKIYHNVKLTSRWMPFCNHNITIHCLVQIFYSALDVTNIFPDFSFVFYTIMTKWVRHCIHCIHLFWPNILIKKLPFFNLNILK